MNNPDHKTSNISNLILDSEQRIKLSVEKDRLSRLKLPSDDKSAIASLVKMDALAAEFCQSVQSALEK